MSANILKKTGLLLENSATIINFANERKTHTIKRFACIECEKIGAYCPQWIANIRPTDDEFEILTIEEKLEWLYHTRPFPRPS